ncbi:MAG: alpha/beta fold hydrolase [Myxococcota bacterium]
MAGRSSLVKKKTPHRLRRALLIALGLPALALGALYVTRLSWGPGLIVPAPDPTYAPRPLPRGVDRAIESERTGARVRAWVLEPPGAARATLLMLHGIRSSKTTRLADGRRYAQQGFRVVLVDSRGHGESSGRWLTYGIEESRDLIALVDVLEGEGALAAPLMVHGVSYGAATAVQYAAADARVATTFAISPFTSLRAVARAYAEWIAGPVGTFMPESMLDDVLREAGRQGSFDPEAACPLCAATDIQGELIVAHSRDDERIPFAHAEAIVDAAGGPLVEVRDASHNQTGASEVVRRSVDEWLRRAADREASPESGVNRTLRGPDAQEGSPRSTTAVE